MYNPHFQEYYKMLADLFDKHKGEVYVIEGGYEMLVTSAGEEQPVPWVHIEFKR